MSNKIEPFLRAKDIPTVRPDGSYVHPKIRRYLLSIAMDDSPLMTFGDKAQPRKGSLLDKECEFPDIPEDITLP